MSTQAASYPQGFVDHTPVYDNAKSCSKRKRKRKRKQGCKTCQCARAAKL